MDKSTSKKTATMMTANTVPDISRKEDFFIETSINDIRLLILVFDSQTTVMAKDNLNKSKEAKLTNTTALKVVA